MELNVTGAGAVQVSDLTFGAEFNESLIHQAVVAFMAGGRQGTRARRTVAMLVAVAASHGVKKVLVVRVPVLSAAHCGVGAAKRLLLNHRIMLRS